MKKKQFVIIGAVVFLIMVVVVVIISIENGSTQVKDLREIVGKELTMTEGVLYCENVTPEMFNDDFSIAYLKAVKFTVDRIDEETMTTSITVLAPPLKKIMESCLPSEMDGDFDDLFKTYMNDIYSTISNYPEEGLVSTIVVCAVVENNGLKIVSNNDFINAVFPDVQQLLSELMLEVLATQEG